MFTERIQNLAKGKNIKIAQMLKDLNMGQGTFSTWKKRGTVPNGETLQKIADYFGVTVDYLLGKTGKQESPCEAGIPDNSIQEAYNKAPEDIKNAVRKLLDL